MKFRPDRYDNAMIVLVGVLAVAVVATTRIATTAAPTPSRAVEAEMARAARTALLERIYAPVEQLRSQPQGALLKLEEISRRYPGEAHGYILKGEILHRLGACGEAAENFATAVKINPEYLDRNSPLSRRATIETLVEEPAASAGHAASAVRYLRSRLAGGCE